MLIVLEGPDKSGKSTIGAKVAEKLDTVLFKELPRQSKIRRILNNPDPAIRIKGKDEFERLLTKMYMDNRVQYQPLLKDLIKFYNCVIIDRYVISTKVYGKFYEKEDFKRHLEKIILPTITFMIIPSEEQIINRLHIDKDVADFYETEEKVLKYREKYLKYYKKYPENIELIETNETSKRYSIDNIVDMIVNKVVRI